MKRNIIYMTVISMFLLASCTHSKLADQKIYSNKSWSVLTDSSSSISAVGVNKLLVVGAVVIEHKSSKNKIDPFNYKLAGYLGSYYIELRNRTILYEIPLSLGASMKVYCVNSSSNKIVCDEFVMCLPIILDELNYKKFTGQIKSENDYYISLVNEFKVINAEEDYEVALDFYNKHSELGHGQVYLERDLIKVIRTFKPRVTRVESTKD